MERYLRVLREIPAGSTLTPLQVALRAGRPGAARTVGRLVRQLAAADSPEPWHRVVSADGSLQRDAAERHLARLRGEDARPRAGESVLDFARRRDASFVASLRKRRYGRIGDPRTESFDPRFVELFDAEEDALARGFAAFESPAEEAAVVRDRSADLPAQLEPLDQRLVHRAGPAFLEALRSRGVARLPGLLHSAECERLCRAFDDDSLFVRSVDMAPHGFGIGRYRFLEEPLPFELGLLRRALYDVLVEPARRFEDAEYPDRWPQFAEHCTSNGQSRPACILLRYTRGGVNHPHRDLYGNVRFPWQAVVLLSRPGIDFEGGRFFLEDSGAEPREEHELGEGDLLVFPSARRPAASPGRPGPEVRHGTTVVTRGERYALGLVLPLAR